MAQEIDKNIGRLLPSNSIIIYPSLTSPAFVHKDGPLHIIVAGDERLAVVSENSTPGMEPGSELGVEAVRFCHSHLLLFPWRDMKGEAKTVPDGSNIPGAWKDPLYPEPSGRGDIFHKGYHWTCDMRDLTGFKNMIYNNKQHDGPILQFSEKNCNGWYLGTLEKEEDTSVYFRGDNTKPFGILGKAAVAQYIQGKCPYLFHFEFSKIPNRQGLTELIWASTIGVGKKLQYVISAQDVFLPVFTKEIVKGGQASHVRPLLTPAETYGLDERETKRCAHSYALFGLGADNPSKKEQEKDPANLACMKQDGRLFGPRHPVLFSEAPLLNVGVIADPHLSSRQALYKLVGARVIPGVDNLDENLKKSAPSAYSAETEVPTQKLGFPLALPDPSDSPLIGPMAHENLQSTKDLFNKMTKNKTADVIAFVGDIYDHIRNCHPAEYMSKADNDINKASRTGFLWEQMRYKEKFETDRSTYPRYIDALMGPGQTHLKKVYKQEV